MLCYCKKCGRIISYSEYIECERICDFCQIPVYPVPEEFVATDYSLKNGVEEQFMDEYIKSSPEFDPDAFARRLEYEVAHANDFNESMAFYNNSKASSQGRASGNPYGVECPYCHAANVRKISFLGRAVSSSIFGLGSGKIGKQWHCNKCGSDF